MVVSNRLLTDGLGVRVPPVEPIFIFGRVSELVDDAVSKTVGVAREGSSPSLPTILCNYWSNTQAWLKGSVSKTDRG